MPPRIVTRALPCPAGVRPRPLRAPPSRRFAPGARTAWHTHPVGQTVFVAEGVGLCQREGGPVEEVRPGDRVYFEPGENHWHGATPERFNTQIAYQESDESGRHTVWGRHVTEEEYPG